jgi:hypothetical protein
MIDLETAAELDKLAERAARMRPPMNSNPHAFHEDRSELAAAIRAIAMRLRNKPARSADEPPAPARAARVIGREVRHIAGRTVQVLVRARAAAPAGVR